MHNIRLITPSDFPQVRRMMFSFHAESPYKDQELSEDKLASVVHYFSETNNDRCAVLAVDDENFPVGVIAGYTRPNLFNGELVAVEQVLWITPEYRKGKIADDLIHAFEFWAKKVGCSYITVSSLENETTKVIDRFYKRRNYRPIEHAYIKDI